MKAKMLRALFCAVSVLISLSTFAQDIRQPQRIVPPSPEAASLGRYGNWPVSLYTGIPQINVPVYTIDYRGFKLPISLSYHASGIKVEDVASWVGTGWALEGGGVITRTVMGIPDEVQNGFLRIPLKGAALPALFDVTNDASYKLFMDIVEETYDTEPDVFHFNFGGVSGRFFFDETGNIVSIPVSTIKVKHHPLIYGQSPADNYWEIIDDKGTTYILGQENAVEKTTMSDDDQMYHKHILRAGI